MRTIVFVGPTVSANDVRQILPTAKVAGPVVRGDIIAAARGEPVSIGIIDGYFEHQLPVWHKEILWALARGCRVYGAASMGALRACELAAFGMVGVGTVFAWYRDGVIEDDDEVAIAHEDASSGFRARSDAMVNVRATLAAAVQQDAVDATTAAQLLDACKAKPYPSRDLRGLVVARLGDVARQRLLAWLESGYVNQKRLDALAMLRRMSGDAAERPVHPAPFELAYTEVFHELMRATAGRAADSAFSEAEAPLPLEDLLEELRLRGLEAYQDVRLAALEGLLARRSRGVSGDALEAAVLEEAVAVLRERGLLPALLERARAKSALLASDERPSVRGAPEALLARHFASLGRPVPADLDAHARALGWERSDLVQAVAREQWFAERSGC